LRRTMRNGAGGLRGHYCDSTMGLEGSAVTEVMGKLSALSFQLGKYGSEPLLKADSFYGVNSAGLPVKRSIRFAIGG
jgi:hypothetical protein